MKKFLFSAALVVAFTVSSTFAQTCPGGGCGGGGKDKNDKKKDTNSTATVQVSL